MYHINGEISYGGSSNIWMGNSKIQIHLLNELEKFGIVGHKCAIFIFQYKIENLKNQNINCKMGNLTQKFKDCKKRNLSRLKLAKYK